MNRTTLSLAAQVARARRAAAGEGGRHRPPSPGDHLDGAPAVATPLSNGTGAAIRPEEVAAFFRPGAEEIDPDEPASTTAITVIERDAEPTGLLDPQGRPLVRERVAFGFQRSPRA